MTDLKVCTSVYLEPLENLEIVSEWRPGLPVQFHGAMQPQVLRPGRWHHGQTWAQRLWIEEFSSAMQRFV